MITSFLQETHIVLCAIDDCKIGDRIEVIDICNLSFCRYYKVLIIFSLLNIESIDACSANVFETVDCLSVFG